MCSETYPYIHLQQTRQREVCSSTFIRGKWEHPIETNAARNNSSEVCRLWHSSELGVLFTPCSWGYVLNLCNI